MIKLTRLNGSEITINSEAIELIEETPDTHITLLNGNRYLVREPACIIVEKIAAFRGKILRHASEFIGKKYLRRRLTATFRPHYHPQEDD